MIVDILNPVENISKDLFWRLQHFQFHYFKEYIWLVVGLILWCNHLYQNNYFWLITFYLIRYMKMIHKIYIWESNKSNLLVIKFLHFWCKMFSSLNQKWIQYLPQHFLNLHNCYLYKFTHNNHQVVGCILIQIEIYKIHCTS